MAKKPTEKTVPTPDVEETYLDKTVSFEDGEETITGTVTSIDADGILTIETEDGTKYEAEPKDVKLVEDDEEDVEEEEEEEVKPAKEKKTVAVKTEKKKTPPTPRKTNPNPDISKHQKVYELLANPVTRVELRTGVVKAFPAFSSGSAEVMLYECMKFAMAAGIVTFDGITYTPTKRYK